MSAVFLTQKIESESAIKGELKGIAYSGSVIPEHGFLSNLIVDVSTLKVAKEKTPIFRDHNPSMVVGQGKVSIEGSKVLIEGTLSKKTSNAQEIMALAEDGFEWELSIGIHNGRIEEVKDTEVNGLMVSHGHVLRDGLLREVSVVALGADKNTNAQILSQLKGDKPVMKLTQEQFVKLACACGGHKDTTPEELQEIVEKKNLMTEEQEQKIDALEKEVADLKEAIAQKEAEIAEIKATEEAEEREEQIEEALKAKGVKFSADKIKSAAKSKETTEMMLGLISDMQTPGSKINEQFTKKVDLSGASLKAKNDPEALRLAADALVKEGKASSFIEALEMVGG